MERKEEKKNHLKFQNISHVNDAKKKSNKANTCELMHSFFVFTSHMCMPLEGGFSLKRK